MTAMGRLGSPPTRDWKQSSELLIRADRLAINAGDALDLALAGASVQQGMQGDS